MKLLSIILMMINAFPIGQKYVVHGKDTLLAANTKGDTIACSTFEKVNGRIINITDGACQSQGLWIIRDSTGAYWTGMAKDDHEIGIWKHFDKDNKLLEETEEVAVGKDTYLVKDIIYKNGVPKVLVNKPIYGFFLKIIWVYCIVLMLALFSRVFINSRIYNIENNTDYSAIYFHFGPFVSNNYSHSLQCMFSFWFSDYKPENRKRVLLSNTLSVISLVMFFGAIICLGVEIH